MAALVRSGLASRGVEPARVPSSIRSKYLTRLSIRQNGTELPQSALAYRRSRPTARPDALPEIQRPRRSVPQWNSL